MPIADVNGLELYYELHGSGHPIVFISGTAHDLRNDPDRGSGPLEQAFQVLMFDQRGLGRSGKPDVPYTMADYADDVAALMDVVGWQRAHVVGNSFGGMVAMHVALRHPQRVERLVLACASSGGAGGTSFELTALQSLPEAERRPASLRLLDTRNDVTTDPPTLAPGFQRVLAAMQRRVVSDDPAALRGVQRQLEARSGHDVWDDLPRIAAPTLVIGGRYDGIAPVANLERVASRIPRATLALFDGGHQFFEQDPSAWPAVVDFLRR